MLNCNYNYMLNNTHVDKYHLGLSKVETLYIYMYVVLYVEWILLLQLISSPSILSIPLERAFETIMY